MIPGKMIPAPAPQQYHPHTGELLTPDNGVVGVMILFGQGDLARMNHMMALEKTSLSWGQWANEKLTRAMSDILLEFENKD
jgi:hypothetical protein